MFPTFDFRCIYKSFLEDDSGKPLKEYELLILGTAFLQGEYSESSFQISFLNYDLLGNPINASIKDKIFWYERNFDINEWTLLHVFYIAEVPMISAKVNYTSVNAKGLEFYNQFSSSRGMLLKNRKNAFQKNSLLNNVFAKTTRIIDEDKLLQDGIDNGMVSFTQESNLMSILSKLNQIRGFFVFVNYTYDEHLNELELEYNFSGEPTLKNAPVVYFDTRKTRINYLNSRVRSSGLMEPARSYTYTAEIQTGDERITIKTDTIFNIMGTKDVGYVNPEASPLSMRDLFYSYAKEDEIKKAKLTGKKFIQSAGNRGTELYKQFEELKKNKDFYSPEFRRFRKIIKDSMENVAFFNLKRDILGMMYYEIEFQNGLLISNEFTLFNQNNSKIDIEESLSAGSLKFKNPIGSRFNIGMIVAITDKEAGFNFRKFIIRQIRHEYSPDVGSKLILGMYPVLELDENRNIFYLNRIVAEAKKVKADKREIIKEIGGKPIKEQIRTDILLKDDTNPYDLDEVEKILKRNIKNYPLFLSLLNFRDDWNSLISMKKNRPELYK